jgi:hypothetical protein
MGASLIGRLAGCFAKNTVCMRDLRKMAVICEADKITVAHRFGLGMTHHAPQ